MEWFNIYGLLFITMIMIPNIIFADRLSPQARRTQRNQKIAARSVLS